MARLEVYKKNLNSLLATDGQTNQPFSIIYIYPLEINTKKGMSEN